MARVTDPSFKFWYDEKWYTVQGAETMMRIGAQDDISTMRSEYTRMRDVAQKRIKRLEKQFPSSKAVTSHLAGFPKLKEIDPRDFAKAFADLAKFVRAKGSTVTGQKQIKEKTIKTWQDQGLNLNQGNYDKTIKILEEMRRQHIVYGSDKVVELSEIMMDFDEQRMNQWLDHLDILLQRTDELQEIPDLNGYDFDEIMAMLGD